MIQAAAVAGSAQDGRKQALERDREREKERTDSLEARRAMSLAYVEPELESPRAGAGPSAPSLTRRAGTAASSGLGRDSSGTGLTAGGGSGLGLGRISGARSGPSDQSTPHAWPGKGAGPRPGPVPERPIGPSPFSVPASLTPTSSAPEGAAPGAASVTSSGLEGSLEAPSLALQPSAAPGAEPWAGDRPSQQSQAGGEPGQGSAPVRVGRLVDRVLRLTLDKFGAKARVDARVNLEVQHGAGEGPDESPTRPVAPPTGGPGPGPGPAGPNASPAPADRPGPAPLALGPRPGPGTGPLQALVPASGASVEPGGSVGSGSGSGTSLTGGRGLDKLSSLFKRARFSTLFTTVGEESPLSPRDPHPWELASAPLGPGTEKQVQEAFTFDLFEEHPTWAHFTTSQTGAKAQDWDIRRAKATTPWQRLWWSRFRKEVFMTLTYPDYSPLALWIGWFIMAIICLNTATFCVETVPHYRGTPVMEALTIVDYVCMGIFTVEWLPRLLCCPNMLRFWLNFFNLVDAVAILPFYIELMVNGTSGYAFHTRIVRLLRLLRVLRMVRSVPKLRHLSIVVNTLQTSADVLGMLGFLLIILLVCFGTIFYFVEPQTFDSIPQGMYYSQTTFTTTGYGDLYPKTNWGRFVASLAMLLCMVIISLPIAVIGGNFSTRWTEFKEFQSSVDRSNKVCPTFHDFKEALVTYQQGLDDVLSKLQAGEQAVENEVVKVRTELAAAKAAIERGTVLSPALGSHGSSAKGAGSRGFMGLVGAVWSRGGKAAEAAAAVAGVAQDSMSVSSRASSSKRNMSSFGGVMAALQRKKWLGGAASSTSHSGLGSTTSLGTAHGLETLLGMEAGGGGGGGGAAAEAEAALAPVPMPAAPLERFRWAVRRVVAMQAEGMLWGERVTNARSTAGRRTGGRLSRFSAGRPSVESRPSGDARPLTDRGSGRKASMKSGHSATSGPARSAGSVQAQAQAGPGSATAAAVDARSSSGTAASGASASGLARLNPPVPPLAPAPPPPAPPPPPPLLGLGLGLEWGSSEYQGDASGLHSIRSGVPLSAAPPDLQPMPPTPSHLTTPPHSPAHSVAATPLSSVSRSKYAAAGGSGGGGSTFGQRLRHRVFSTAPTPEGTSYAASASGRTAVHGDVLPYGKAPPAVYVTDEALEEARAALDRAEKAAARAEDLKIQQLTLASLAYLLRSDDIPSKLTQLDRQHALLASWQSELGPMAERMMHVRDSVDELAWLLMQGMDLDLSEDEQPPYPTREQRQQEEAQADAAEAAEAGKGGSGGGAGSVGGADPRAATAVGFLWTGEEGSKKAGNGAGQEGAVAGADASAKRLAVGGGFPRLASLAEAGEPAVHGLSFSSARARLGSGTCPGAPNAGAVAEEIDTAPPAMPMPVPVPEAPAAARLEWARDAAALTRELEGSMGGAGSDAGM
ncbi:hypothetical protein HYH03_003380 [Edaphochlamys debaryana]|uniref:Ion transport domain-containing protein n=1 Tax=Edaphochlamys debaryana TaxID=47281 RepID=A0A835Y9P6_9CHLO|nr:hypothetical protein HYH03_003380 [Edaphochlamys debaryana]|eukprot:KAG2498633.1 hypothetical protein HYH03_003380 [Edaphochlamys debaryana]